jgi:hypothetical protein
MSVPVFYLLWAQKNPARLCRVVIKFCCPLHFSAFVGVSRRLKRFSEPLELREIYTQIRNLSSFAPFYIYSYG